MYSRSAARFQYMLLPPWGLSLRHQRRQMNPKQLKNLRVKAAAYVLDRWYGVRIFETGAYHLFYDPITDGHHIPGSSLKQEGWLF